MYLDECMLPFHFVMYDIKLLSAMYGYIIFIDSINFYVVVFSRRRRMIGRERIEIERKR